MIKLDVATYISFITGIAISDIESLVSILFLLTGAICSIIGVCVKIKHYKDNDGKIDKNEAEDILNDIKDIKDDLKK